MKRNSFDSMSLDQLWATHEEIVEILESKIKTAKAKLEKRLAELRLASANEVNGKKSGRRFYPKVQPKYRNPQQPLETWSGRGKQPRWVSDLVQSGKDINDLRIPSGLSS
jgi:DNA-binding protein H-NS